MAATTITPPATPRSDAADNQPSFVAKWYLVILAVGAWMFTIAGLMLDHIFDASNTFVVGIYVLAYFSGGTLATRDAIADLLDGKVNVDLLMVLAALGAATLSQWAEGAILLSLFSTSNAMEHYSMDRTKNAVRALMDLTPPTARVKRDGQLLEISVEELAIDDIVVVQPGERIPADARVSSGASAVDQAAITGESIPVGKGIGDELFAGTINGNGALEASVTKLASDSTLARIVQLVSNAQEDQSDLQEFAEGFEGKYAVFVILFSALVTAIPWFFGTPFEDAFYRGMTLLVVMSPCALVISTPAATLSALANAARKGVLVKGGRAMDILGSVGTVAFDKTGTLTIGEPKLTDIVTLNGTSAHDLLDITAAAEALSEHPIGQAIVNAARLEGRTLPEASDLRAIPGHGIVATVAGRELAIGNVRLFQQLDIPVPANALEHIEALGHDGKSTMIVGDQNSVLGILAVADVLRPGVAEIIRGLKQAGVRKIVMLTGDNERVAHAIASHIGIDEVRANLLPEQKLEVIKELKADERVAMVGDGVNDAPALATADIGIAMGSGGTDVALETADVVLMSDDLARVGYSIGLSRKMRRIIKINLTFALSVIALLAISNLIVGIPMPLGVVGHEGSTVIVLLNGLRLLGYGGHFGDLVSRQRESRSDESATPAWTVRTA